MSSGQSDKINKELKLKNVSQIWFIDIEDKVRRLEEGGEEGQSQ